MRRQDQGRAVETKYLIPSGSACIQSCLSDQSNEDEAFVMERVWFVME